MIFNSFTFGVFFAVVFSCYRLLWSWRARKLLLLGASYLFYAAWNPPLVLLLFGSTLVDWVAATRIWRAQSERAKRAWLLVSLTSNLGLLAGFKYSGFLLTNFQGLLWLSHIDFVPPDWSIVLPVGISFYTFQTLSFTIDVYRGRIDPTRSSALDFALFVSFFPQLVAGPIVRADEFLPQLETPRTPTLRHLQWGIALLTVGLFQKVVLADAILARTADLVFTARSLSVGDAWAGTLAFSGQIFFDFAGYSTCAIGVAMCFGFALPDNFRFPYGAASFSDFWRRWHISLSSWLRDYLYVSLGGNRRGAVRTQINLLATMLLGGLWHGASWNFVLWGALHGSFLALERAVRRGRREVDTFSPLAWITVQAGVLLAWIPFRAPTIADSIRIAASLVGLGTSEESTTTFINRTLVTGVVGATYLTHAALRKYDLESLAARVPPVAVGAALGIAWSLIWLAQPDDRAFIYFQF